MKAKKVNETLKFEEDMDPYNALGVGHTINVRFVSEDDDDIIDEDENILFPFVPHPSMQKAVFNSNDTTDIPEDIMKIVNTQAMYVLGATDIQPSIEDIMQYKQWVRRHKNTRF